MRALFSAMPILQSTIAEIGALGYNGATMESPDRRPIATRNRKWAQTSTAWLAARNVSPNAISIAGMCACIIGGVSLVLTSSAYHRVEWLIAAAGAQLRLT